MLSPLALTLAVLAPPDDPARQFDFWIGEWSVQNRHWQEDGTWREGDVTRARITPVVDGGAILEEWVGPFRGGFMNGFSLRAWDPAAARWSLLLFWTMNGDGGFGQLHGTFRHGRGEFFSGWTDPDGTEVTQRYSFSDALPDTVRWDSAVTRDGGRTWHTDWIMEFSRTRAAAEVTEDRLFTTPWTEGELDAYPEARALDWLRGEWAGVQEADGAERPARLRCVALGKGTLVVDSLEVQVDQGWDKRFSVSGYVARRGGWERWSLSEADTTLRRALGAPGDGVARFEAQDADGAVLRREVLTREGEGRLSIVVEEGGEVVSRTTLARR